MPITINGTTGISGTDGSASTPALQGLDTNTGMFFPAADTVAFATGGTERARIDSGGRLIVNGTTPPYAARVGSYPVSQYGFAAQQVTSVNGSYNYLSDCSLFGGIGYHSLFLVGGSTVGTITSNATTATYATSSDYRLKEQVAPMTGALAKNELLNPVTYKWKVDGSDGQGFIAHELQAVFPDAVTGEKDAVDDDGKPVYQGVDTSFLVGHLVACVKELKAELDSVKAELAALKSA